MKAPNRKDIHPDTQRFGPLSKLKFSTAKCPGRFGEKVFLQVDSFKMNTRRRELINWFSCISKVGKSALTYLPLFSGDRDNFFYKEHQFNHNFPSLFISDIITLNADKCTLFHRTISILDINKHWLQTFLPILVLEQ